MAASSFGQVHGPDVLGLEKGAVTDLVAIVSCFAPRWVREQRGLHDWTPFDTVQGAIVGAPTRRREVHEGHVFCCAGR